jgi:hypothetical protein
MPSRWISPWRRRQLVLVTHLWGRIVRRLA